MKQTKTNESHKHVWIETTRASDTDNVMISHACECGMWKIEQRQAKFTKEQFYKALQDKK